MTIYLLVHGAYGGGWQFKTVAAQLSAAGHEVYRPTLTGLGERAHLLSRETNLTTHVTDVVNVLQFEQLDDVVLVGKSYGGMVVTGVAEQVPERLRRIIYLDAVVPQHQQSLVNVLGAGVEARMQQLVAERGDGWRLPAMGADDPRVTVQPFACLTEKLSVSNPAAAAVPHTYVRYRTAEVGAHTDMTRRVFEYAQTVGWDTREISAHHDLEQTNPAQLVALLLELA